MGAIILCLRTPRGTSGAAAEWLAFVVCCIVIGGRGIIGDRNSTAACGRLGARVEGGKTKGSYARAYPGIRPKARGKRVRGYREGWWCGGDV